ncbi:helix-turn-helix transcriptional regulator [Ottowia sp. GY511]|uniref:ArsR/SmtB family transcription factor n=1 Tax=Ottowia flava TaxID=2675430 RepID=A0ABW4KU16_9BURK|nr:helix-turn-helix transcriptional regulator [Ottowia sp. GY511]TXK27045.1 helix-turn-helix transcriptional regulator [Ottowia sp. GY511]
MSCPATALHEPRIARVAALLADSARSRMLACLLSGELVSAGELARAASVTPSTASGHLARLLDEGLVSCEPRGRHRYYRLASADVAHALEALAVVAERTQHASTWSHPARQRLRHARCCYGHIAGELGVRLWDTWLTAGVLRPAADGLTLTPDGEAWFIHAGMAAPTPSRQRRYAYACLDWSERRDHLAGQLADAWLTHCLGRDWLRRSDGRALQLTPAGERELLPLLLSGSASA